MNTLTDITVILGVVLVIVTILLMSYVIFIYIKEERRSKRPLTNKEIEILISLQPTFEKADEILSKYVADKTNVKLSWIQNQFDVNIKSNTEDEYKRVLKGIISRE